MNCTAKALAAAAAFLILAVAASFAAVGRAKQVQTVDFSILTINEIA